MILRKLYPVEVENIRRFATAVADSPLCLSQNYIEDYINAAERYEILCEDYERIATKLEAAEIDVSTYWQAYRNELDKVVQLRKELHAEREDGA